MAGLDRSSFNTEPGLRSISFPCFLIFGSLCHNRSINQPPGSDALSGGCVFCQPLRFIFGAHRGRTCALKYHAKPSKRVHGAQEAVKNSLFFYIYKKKKLLYGYLYKELYFICPICPIRLIKRFKADFTGNMRAFSRPPARPVRLQRQRQRLISRAHPRAAKSRPFCFCRFVLYYGHAAYTIIMLKC